jgi:NitT/TauT family transport system permease protein
VGGLERADGDRVNRKSNMAVVWLTRGAIVVVALAAWQLLPQIERLRDFSPIFDPFFVSSPDLVAHRMWALAIGSHGPYIWPYLAATLEGTLVGAAVGIAAGVAVGLVLSNNARLTEIVGPFVAALNAVPRIALIPIIVILLGPSLGASIATAVLVVFFIAFYNAFEGGRSVPRDVIDNALLLGASNMRILLHVRLPYAGAWTFAALPNALSFGLISVVTAEILTGTLGMGRLMLNALTAADAGLTFSVVVYLSVAGLTLVGLSSELRRRWLHWWARI